MLDKLTLNRQPREATAKYVFYKHSAALSSAFSHCNNQFETSTQVGTGERSTLLVNEYRGHLTLNQNSITQLLSYTGTSWTRTHK